MKLDAMKLGMATGIVFALIWALCSLLVALMPTAMMRMSGHMIHADLGGMNWTMTGTGLILGLILWTVLPAVLVWAVASVYNRLVG